MPYLVSVQPEIYNFRLEHSTVSTQLSANYLFLKALVDR
jgi:hypothetical protein